MMVHEEWRGLVWRDDLGADMTLEQMLSPDRAPAPGTPLDLVWDTSLLGTSYDFLTWLANADCYRQLHKYGPVRVRFAGPENEFLTNIMRPALSLFPDMEEAHENIEPTQSLVHLIKLAVEIYRRTRIGPRLRYKPNTSGRPSNYVTITLREVNYQHLRNSNLGAWLGFARMLQAQGQEVVFVRDNAKANEPLEGFGTDPCASTDLLARMFLYERAQMNYFVCNGPSVLATYTQHVPYVCFMKAAPDFPMTQAPNARYYFGIDHGEQLPWATGRQTLVWTQDCLAEIIAAYGLARWSRSAA